MSDPTIPPSSTNHADELALRRQQKAAGKPKIVKPQDPHALPAFARPAAKQSRRLGEAASALGRRMVAPASRNEKTGSQPSPQVAKPAPSRAAPSSFREKSSPAELAEEARYSILSSRLSLIADMSPAERTIVSRLDHAPRRIHQAGSDLATEGEIAPPPMFIVSGWACRLRVTPSGRRQILGFLLPGDAVCLRGAAEYVSAFNVCALTTVETVDATSFLKLAAQANAYPGLSLAVEGAKLQDDIFTANHIVRLGIQTRAERAANLLMELRWRLQQTGLAEGAVFPMPLMRETLGDALGIHPSRVGWVMGWLRARNILSVAYGQAQVLSSTAAAQLSGFKAPEERFSAPPGTTSFSSTG
jgi:CRP-like cAMP-binding protein